MPHWTDSETHAHVNLGDALAVVDNLLSFAKDGKGKPSAKERALFAAAVVFTYGVWENFIEQLVIEIATNTASEVTPERVPEPIRKVLEKKSAWELSVSPGWRSLWSDHVRKKAVGDGNDEFGMNTAKSGQVKSLLLFAGVTDPFILINSSAVPSHLVPPKNTVVDAIDALVELRGEIVHTGKVPDALRRAHVHSWRGFVEAAARSIDQSCRDECKKLCS